MFLADSAGGAAKRKCRSRSAADRDGRPALHWMSQLTAGGQLSAFTPSPTSLLAYLLGNQSGPMNPLFEEIRGRGWLCRRSCCETWFCLVMFRHESRTCQVSQACFLLQRRCVGGGGEEEHTASTAVSSLPLWLFTVCPVSPVGCKPHLGPHLHAPIRKRCRRTVMGLYYLSIHICACSKLVAS